MGLFKGSLTFRTFLCEHRADDRDAETVADAFQQHRFRGLGQGGPSSFDESGSPAAIGWVTARNWLDTDLSIEKVQAGRYYIFSLRRDQLRIPKSLLDARFDLEERAQREALGLDRLPYKKKRELKAQIKEELEGQVQPTTRSFPIIWDPRGGRVLVGSTSEKSCDDFVALFGQTFDREVTPLLPGPLSTVLTGDESAADRASLISLIPEEVAAARQPATVQFGD